MSKITICGSMAFYAQMNGLAEKLREIGFDVYSPQIGEGADFSKMNNTEIARIKGHYVNLHRKNIEESAAVLIANYKKGEIDNYIGASTLIEMGFAYVYGKKIFLLFDIPTNEKKIEALGLNAIPLYGDIEKII